MGEDALCRCGCGQKTKIAPRTYTSRGWVKGQPQPYLRGHAAWKDRGPKWIVNEAGCWIWQRHVSDQGYALGTHRREANDPGQGLIHVHLYRQKFGAVPDGLYLDHACHTADATCGGGPRCPHRRCVNPDHLEPVTPLENVHRSVSIKATESDMATVYALRVQGESWRRIAGRFGMTHAPLVTRLRKYCERNALAWP